MHARRAIWVGWPLLLAPSRTYPQFDASIPTSWRWACRAGTSDCWWFGNAGAARARAGQQALRSHSALSVVADLFSSRCRSLSLDIRGLGRRRVMVARSVARTAVQERVRLSRPVKASTRSLCMSHGEIVALCSPTTRAQRTRHLRDCCGHTRASSAQTLPESPENCLKAFGHR